MGEVPIGTEDCPISEIESILVKNAVIQNKWIQFAKELGTPEGRLKTFQKDFHDLGKITFSDLIRDILQLWRSRSGSAATLSTLLNVVENTCEAGEAGELIRLEFNLSCKSYKIDTAISYNDLSKAFQQKVTKTFKRFFPKIEIQDCLPKLKDDILVNLMTGKRPILFIQTIPEQPKHYIRRSLLPKNVLELDRLLERSTSDIFLFTGMDMGRLSILGKNKNIGSSSLQLRHVTAQFIIIDQLSHFERICDITSKSIHWLHQESEGHLSWVKSRGKMKIIQEAVDISRKPLTEEQFIEGLETASSNQPICISDQPGMGKSILLANFGFQLVKKFPDRAVFLIQMKTLLEKIEQEGTGSNVSGIVNALQSLTCKDKLSKAILKSQLISKDGITIELLLDGFDEVCYDHVDPASEIVRLIHTSIKSIRLWITTRPHLLEKLEDSLSILGTQLQPFSDDDQLRFLTSYWTHGPEMDTVKLTNFAHLCLKSLPSQKQDIAGIPLQCYLIAEVYEDEATSYARSRATSATPTILINSITDLYKFMVANRIQKYLTNYVDSDFADMDSVMEVHAILSMRLLFSNTFYNDSRKLTYFGANVLSEVGFITLNYIAKNDAHSKEPDDSISESDYMFVHKTFAEYFAAWHLIDKLSGGDWEDDLTRLVASHVLRCRENTSYDNDRRSASTTYDFLNSTLCYFFNSLADGAKIDASPISFKPLFTSAQTRLEIVHTCGNQDLFNLFSFIQSREGFANHEIALFNESTLLFFIERSGLKFLKHIFELFEKHHEFDDSLKSRAISSAVTRGNFSILEFLITEKQLKHILENENGPIRNLISTCVSFTIGRIEDKVQIIRYLASLNPSLMHSGISPLVTNHVHPHLMMELITEHKVTVFATEENNDTVLHLSHVRRMSIQEYNLLLSSIPDNDLKILVNLQGKNGDTPLVRLLETIDPPQETLVKFKNAGYDFNKRDPGGITPPALSIAIQHGRNSSTMQSLISLGADVQWRDERNRTLVHLAAAWGNADAILFLAKEQGLSVNCKDIEKQSPLDYAIRNYSHGNPEKTCRVLRQLGAEYVDFVNDQGQTLLHVAAMQRKYNSVRTIIQLGADVNAKDNLGNTALHLVINQPEEVTNPVGQIGLFYPVDYSRNHERRLQTLDIIKILLENNANPNILNNKMETPIIIAFRVTDIHCVHVLFSHSETKIEWSADIGDLAMKFLLNLESPLDPYMKLKVDDNVLFAIIRECAKHGVDISQEKGGMTLLHHAADQLNLGRVKCLVTNGANVNSKNSQLETPLHMALSSGRSQMQGANMFAITLYLCDNGTDLWAKDSQNATFLHRFMAEVSVMARSLNFPHLVRCLADNNALGLFNVAGSYHLPGMFGVTGMKDEVTPFHMAVRSLNYLKIDEDTLAILHSNGVDFNATDDHGYSVLYYAVNGQKSVPLSEFLSSLIKFGANPRKLTKSNLNLLHHSANVGTYEPLNFFITLGELAINSVDLKGNTPLHFAAKNICGPSWLEPEKVELIMNHGGNINARNHKGRTPLHTASIGKNDVRTARENMIKALIGYGADMDAQDDNNCNFLHLYFTTNTSLGGMKSKIIETQSLVKYLGGLNKLDTFNTPGGSDMATPFQIAVHDSELFEDTLVILHKAGVNFNPMDKNGDSLLSYAVAGNRSLDFISNLIRLGSDIKLTNNNRISNLHLVAMLAPPPTLKSILRLDVFNVDAADVNGNTPLHYAALSEDDALFQKVALLLAKRANAKLANFEGKTAFDNFMLHGRSLINSESRNLLVHHAATSYSLEAFQAFMKLGYSLDVNEVDADGNTALHLVVKQQGISDMFYKYLFLMGKDAAINVKNNEGRTPLHLACLGTDLDTTFRIVRHLIQNGADVYAKDCNSLTFLHVYILECPLASKPLLFAMEFHRLVELLVENGSCDLFNTEGGPGPSPTTPFQLAVMNVELEEKTLLVLKSSGVDFNYVNCKGNSALYYAIIWGKSPDFLSKLIKFGADKQNLICTATERGSIDQLKFLLSLKDLDVNESNMNGSAPIHIAVCGRGRCKN